jgi:hypothetical protein
MQTDDEVNAKIGLEIVVRLTAYRPNRAGTQLHL